MVWVAAVALLAVALSRIGCPGRRGASCLGSQRGGDVMRRPPGPGRSGDRRLQAWRRGVELVLSVSGRYPVIRLVSAIRWEAGAARVIVDRTGDVPMPTMPGSVAAGGSQPPRPPSKILAQFSELHSWLRDCAYSDGKPVGMVQLAIRPKGAVYVVSLRVQDQGGLVMSVEDPHLDDALLLLEAALTAVPPPWTRDPYPLGVSQSKRK